MKCRSITSCLGLGLVRRATATVSHASFSGLARLHGLAATTATPSFRAMTRSRSSQRTINQGVAQPLLGGGSDGGGGDHHKAGQAGPEGDGGRDSHTSKLMVAILTLAPQVIVGVAIMGCGGIFHQCAFAIPSIQRDIADLKSGQARLEADIADLKSGQDDQKTMIQRLCVALGKPECAFPPNVCA